MTGFDFAYNVSQVNRTVGETVDGYRWAALLIILVLVVLGAAEPRRETRGAAWVAGTLALMIYVVLPLAAATSRGAVKLAHGEAAVNAEFIHRDRPEAYLDGYDFARKADESVGSCDEARKLLLDQGRCVKREYTTSRTVYTLVCADGWTGSSCGCGGGRGCCSWHGGIGGCDARSVPVHHSYIDGLSRKDAGWAQRYNACECTSERFDALRGIKRLRESGRRLDPRGLEWKLGWERYAAEHEGFEARLSGAA
jgi:hypothetical protein